MLKRECGAQEKRVWSWVKVYKPPEQNIQSFSRNGYERTLSGWTGRTANNICDPCRHQLKILFEELLHSSWVGLRERECEDVQLSTRTSFSDVGCGTRVSHKLEISMLLRVRGSGSWTEVPRAFSALIVSRDSDKCVVITGRCCCCLPWLHLEASSGDEGSSHLDSFHKVHTSWCGGFSVAESGIDCGLCRGWEAVGMATACLCLSSCWRCTPDPLPLCAHPNSRFIKLLFS